MNTTTNELEKILFRYLADGWRLFPCKDKIPCTENGFKSATELQFVVREYIHKFPGCNWGGILRNGFLIDLDVKKNGEANLKRLITKIGVPLPKTRTHRSGGGGIHIILKRPTGIPFSKVELKEFDSLEIKGDGGYLILPPSKTDDYYRVIDDSPIAEAPKEWIDFAINYKKPKNNAPAPTEGEIIPPGSQDNWLTSMAGTYRKRGDTEEAIFQKLKLDIKRCPQEPGEKPYADTDLRRIAHSVANYPVDEKGNGHKTFTDKAELPEIIASGRHLRMITDDALTALNRSNVPPHIFKRSGALTRIGQDEMGRPFAEILSEAALRGKLARSANFIRMMMRGEEWIATPISPPMDVTRDVGSLGIWGFPPLIGITEAPVLRRDGTVLTQPGYDITTGLYYVPAPGLVVPPIPEAPTEAELRPAIDLVREVFCDFPFDSEASSANGSGALVETVLRPAIDGPVPLAVIDKPQPGTGASLIADTISIVATGHLAATMGMPQSEDEWEKKLSSHLLAGRSLCVIDNIEVKLQSDTLSRYITSTYLSIRPLGRSADIILPNNMSFIATGNNVRLGGDMPRRCYWVRLNAGVARPWLREANFKHPDLRQWVFASRGVILAAILTIARGWITTGRPIPQGLPVLGGFEAYCRTIGGMLAFMGVSSFLGNLSSMYDKMDADTPQWEGFLEAWRDFIGTAPVTVTVAELINNLNDKEELAATLPDSLATRDGRDYSRRLGNALSKRQDMRLPNGLMVTKAGERKRAITWAVVSYQNTNSPVGTKPGELTHRDNPDDFIDAKMETVFVGFEPTLDWQEVPSDVAVPPGLEIRMDFATGKNFARKPPPKTNHDATLGMPAGDAIKLWRSEGAPVIHLGPVENCFDLEELLSNSEVNIAHLEAVRCWLQDHKARANNASSVSSGFY